jgi:hypothetical protein
MKRLLTIGKWMLCFIASVGLACCLILWGANDACVIGAFFFGGIIIALCLGLFDVSDCLPIDKHEHVSLKNGARTMRRAA